MIREILTKCTLALLLVGLNSHALALPVTGTKTDLLILSPLSVDPSCPAGKVCFYSLSADGQAYDVDGAGLVLRSHAAKSFRGSPNCSALASPANGDVCFDSSLGAFRFYNSGWTSATTNDASVVHKAGAETITGAKTFTAALLLSGGATFGADVDAGGFRVKALGPPTLSGDAANKGYVDAVRVFHVHGAASTAAGTQYLGPAGTGSAAAAPVTLFTAPEALTVRRVVCTFDTAPGGMVTDTVTVVAKPSAGAWGALATTCVTLGAATTCAGTATGALAQYDRVGLQLTRDALSASAGVDCEIWGTK